ncbi:MAG TPA: hypothetical protein VGJ19_21370 [Streptosporangiaceae bacterium]
MAVPRMGQLAGSGTGLQRFGGLAGTIESASFLFMIGLLNLVIDPVPFEPRRPASSAASAPPSSPSAAGRGPGSST